MSAWFSSKPPQLARQAVLEFFWVCMTLWQDTQVLCLPITLARNTSLLVVGTPQELLLHLDPCTVRIQNAPPPPTLLLLNPPSPHNGCRMLFPLTIAFDHLMESGRWVLAMTLLALPLDRGQWHFNSSPAARMPVAHPLCATHCYRLHAYGLDCHILPPHLLLP